MTEVLLPGNAVIVFALTLLYALAVCQTIHVSLMYRGFTSGRKRLRLAYESCLVVHFVLSALFVKSLIQAWSPAYAVFGVVFLRLDVLLWFNVFVILLGLLVVLESRRTALVFELVVLTLMTPPFVFGLAEPIYLIAADLVVFTFAVSRRLVGDFYHSRNRVSPLALASTIKSMPEGVAYATSAGRILLVNDSMRRFMLKLGVAADLSNMENMLAAIRKASDPLVEGRVLVGNRVWHVEPSETFIGRKRCVRLLALDITEEQMLEQSLARSNEELEFAKLQLQQTLDQVQDTAEAEALVRMRARVHDVIGQRMSLLHRYLEDGQRDPEKLEAMKPLLKGIVEDLREDAEIDWVIELESVVSAFSLVGVTVNIDGDFPDDPHVALACTALVREAATNAVRHAHATRVDVVMRQSDGESVLCITDNGGSALLPINEGQGLKGMRACVEARGGVFEVRTEPTFTLVATFPALQSKQPLRR